MSRPTLTLWTLFLLFAFVIATSLAAWPQGDAGSVGGVVTDVSGAVIGGANIVITDKSTGTVRTSTSNDAGRYTFVNVVPGVYEVNVKKTGFAQTKSQVRIEVGQAATLNFSMKVGGASEVVEVTTSNVELQTLNATLGNTVSGQALQNLPTLGRDTSSFVTMQAGVSPDGSAAGTVVDQTVFTLDGGNNSNDMDGSSGVYNPNFGDDPAGGLFSNKNNPISGINAGINGGQPSGVMPTPVDSVEEFKVATTNQTADVNNSSGMQVAIVTKRGTNTWHGTAYEYYLDNNFSANTWENNQATPKTPVPDWHRNWFGVAVGGPIIPKEFLGGKTYFFMNYQGARWPNSETITKLVPGPDMRLGILHDSNGNTYNLNTLDPRGIGLNTYVQQLWTKYMPAPTAGLGCGSLAGNGYCDNLNTFAFSANLPIPQNDNFGVARLDHDFGKNWHFMSSYRYYHLTRATDDQIDIGGFFPGDTLGQPAALTNRPQVPWYLVAGLTTNITPHVTNDFHYSFLRNWWQWGSHGDPAQFDTLTAAIEPFGEQRNNVLAPYNVNTQQTRTRFWNGRDNFLRDDVSWLKGNHLIQFGAQYQHNWNYHQRTDNGGGINYYPVYQLGDSLGGGNVDFSALGGPFGTDSTLAREAAAILGIVTDAQQVYTRSGANLTLNPPLTPAFDKVTIPYYNFYGNDTWHLKPTFTLTFGLGWAYEAPPKEDNGKQVIFVGPDGAELSTETYLKNREQAALAGQVYNPVIGFATIGNVTGHPSHMYDPFYTAFSPRVAAAWNPWPDTVIRGGYGRIYGRLNGVGLVLGPLLSPGLIQPVSCSYVLANGTCPNSATMNLLNAFRIGTDGATAPLPPASTTLPQPFYPGVNGNAEAATASPIDPHFRPNSVDSFDFTIQHQINSKISIEMGGISRWIHNELLSVNLNSVPYMMTLGGQQFKNAYANIEKAMGCTVSLGQCLAATPGTTLANLAPQPFFESALAGTGFCNGYANCTTALVSNPTMFGYLQSQNVFSLWSDLDTGGAAPGFNFPLSMMNSTGQIVSNVAMTTSLGSGNYNAAFFTVKMNDWHGMTMQNNFTWGRSLGTGGVVQATSSQVSVDSWNPNTQYGTQPSDRKFVDTLFLVWQSPFFASQRGFAGRLLGGWTPSFVFATGSGAPLFCATQTGYTGNGYSGGAEWGSADGNYVNTDANCVATGVLPRSKVHQLSDGSYNIFGNPDAVLNQLRPLILGYDKNSGGYGTIRGLSYWNLNFGLKKNLRITERFSAEASLNVNNILNHNVLLDPTLGLFQGLGALGAEGTTPRTMEMGIRINF